MNKVEAGTTTRRHLKVVSNTIRCHVHQEPIRVDCHLSECVFHTKYPGVKNCILIYMAAQDLDSLKPIDIGMLKGISASKLARDLAKATVSMRSGTLKVSNQVDIEPRFTTLMNLDVCYSCEAPISGRSKKTAIETKVQRTDSKIWYCSQECCDARPVQYIAVEAECRTDMRTIAEWAVKKYSTLGGLEQALGMNRQLLGQTLKTLLGLDAEEIYSTTQRVKTRSKALVRRTGSRPEWLTKFSELMAPLVAKMEAKYGKASVKLDDLSKEVQRVIDQI